MAKQSSSIALLVGLIISILIALGAIALYFKVDSDYAKLEKDKKAVEDRLEIEQGRFKEQIQELTDARQLVNGGAGRVNLSQYQDTILKDASKQLKEILAYEWVSQKDIDEIKDPTIKKVWEKLRNLKGPETEFTNFQTLYLTMLDQLKAVIHVIPRLRALRVQAREEAEITRKERDDLERELKKEIQAANDRASGLSDQLLIEQRNFDKEKRAQSDQIRQLQAQMTRSEKVFKVEIAKLNSEKATLEDRIRDILKKDRKNFESAEPDGEIILADPESGYAWINRGKNHNLRRGTRFQVFQFIKGGRRKVKGVLLVKAVEADMAQCAILEGGAVIDPISKRPLSFPLKDDPVVKGDLITNPLYDPKDQQEFVFLGNRVTNRTYKLGELKRKITEGGGKVTNTVNIRTNFVVLLSNAEDEVPDEVEKATQFGCIFVTEAELLDYLR